MSCTKSSGRWCAVDLVQEGDLRVAGGDDERRLNLLAAASTTPVARPFLTVTCSHRSVDADLRAERLRSRAARVGDCTHTADRHAPRGDLALCLFTHGVVHQHVGGSRAHRAGPGADDAVDRLRPDDDRVFEPPRQQVGGTHGEQARDVGDRLLVDLLAQRPRELPEVFDVTELLGPDVRRRLVEQRMEDVRDAADPFVVRLERVGVLLAELRERLVRTRRRRRRAASDRREVA